MRGIISAEAFRPPAAQAQEQTDRLDYRILRQDNISAATCGKLFLTILEIDSVTLAAKYNLYSTPFDNQSNKFILPTSGIPVHYTIRHHQDGADIYICDGANFPDTLPRLDFAFLHGTQRQLDVAEKALQYLTRNWDFSLKKLEEKEVAKYLHIFEGRDIETL